MSRTPQPALTDGDLSLEPTSGQGSAVGEFIGFSVQLDGDRVGTLAFRHEDRGVLSVRWNVGADALGLAVRVLRLAVAHAFTTLGAHRLEARIPVDRTDDIRAASICGLRREGIMRTAGDATDRVLVARLVDDASLSSRDGFIAILNAGLPTKRIIGQGVWRDSNGRVLLCELTYKQEWDLPGGVIEVGEAPAVGLVRELQEELGVTVDIQGLLTVNWLPAWRGWDDACVFVFDLGVADDDIIARMTLQETEIKDVHWCDVPTLHQRATAATIELLDALAAAPLPPYREAPRFAE